MTSDKKVSYSYIRRVASELVETSLASAGYSDATVGFIRDSLLEVISSESELDLSKSATLQNQLIIRLDREPDPTFEIEVE